MGESDPLEVDDPRRSRPGGAGREAGGEHRHAGVAGEQRAVAAPAPVMSPSQVGELVALGRGDDYVARPTAREASPGALEPVRVALRVEERRVTLGPEAFVAGRREAQLSPSRRAIAHPASRNRTTSAAGSPSSRSASSRTSRRAPGRQVEHRRSVGGAHGDLALLGPGPPRRQRLEVVEPVRRG